MDEKPPKVAELVRDGIANNKAAIEAALDADAASLYAAVVTALRDGNHASFSIDACAVDVLVPVNAVRFEDRGYNDAIRTRLNHHFSVDDVQLAALNMEDVGCGSVCRELKRHDDVECLTTCCVTSVLCCCVPLLCFWLPFSLYKRKRYLCRCTVRLEAKAGGSVHHPRWSASGGAHGA